MKIIEMSATALGEEIKKGQIGVKEAVKAYLDQIEAVEPSVHAYLDIDEKKIYARVKEVEKASARENIPVLWQEFPLR